MNIKGFNLMLQDFCDYCQHFEPEVEKMDVTSFGEATRYMNNIRCENRRKCARIAESLENRINGKSEAQTTPTACKVVLVGY